MKKHISAFFAALLLSSCALAQVSVTAPWIRATVPQGKATGAFMQLRSAQATRLLAVRSDVAGIAEVHQMDMAGGVMKMHAVDGVDLQAGKTLNLAPGGFHIMLMDLKRQLKEGETVTLTLVLQQPHKKQETLEVKVPVKALTYVNPDQGRAPAMAH
ncbi:copper chaperone PCu(A)C [Janthinobacterium sp.]|uniref:copper chaperone PCu(A)C n=1 Tax=Janthinobacterium sp. TaxID=1871054 RepID=UPI00293D9BC0|nr:copper chaperone PCu(A)C [Janthinobacterium sp.]